MRKNIKTRVICLVVAGIMLTGSLTIAAVIGSPYETLKNAIFDAFSYQNVTMEGSVQLIENGEVLETERVRTIVGNTGSINYSFDRYGEPTGRFFYDTENLSISANVFVEDDGTQWHEVWTGWGLSTPFLGGGTGLTQEDRETARFRFMEMLLDIAVGDLKNHMTMSTSGGVRSITGTITHNQLPEIVRLGLDVVTEESRRWWHGDYGSPQDFSHPLDAPMQSIHFNRIHGNADVDADGNLLYISGHVDLTILNVFGEENQLEFLFEMSFTDIGTSNPQSPFPGAAELFTSDFISEQFNMSSSRGQRLYFTLNDDGSINEDSITTMWPGQRN